MMMDRNAIHTNFKVSAPSQHFPFYIPKTQKDFFFLVSPLIHPNPQLIPFHRENMGFPFPFPTKAIIILPTLCLLFSLKSSSAQSSLGFRCTNTTTCTSLIDYKLPNTTTLSSIRNLFQIKNLRSLLSANSLPITTAQNAVFPASQIIKIPFPCFCRNGTGISNRRPNYVVVPNDGLYHIAAEVFSNLVSYPQIQEVNNISDANTILVGQRLWIPLPCSCDDVDGEKVVHYGHVVEAGSTVSGIAQEFNTSESTLLNLNGMNNSADLKADSILDVPLKVCTSMVRNGSLDYPLLVPNGTYTFTANNCVRCQCNAANNWILECEPSGISLSRGQNCPFTQCSGTPTLDLGNTTSDSDCNRSRCEYAGYRNGTILTALTQESTCPERNNNGASENGVKRWRSNVVLGVFLLTLHLVR